MMQITYNCKRCGTELDYPIGDYSFRVDEKGEDWDSMTDCECHICGKQNIIILDYKVEEC